MIDRACDERDGGLQGSSVDVLVVEDHGVTGHAVSVLLEQRGVSATAIDGRALVAGMRSGQLPAARLVLLDLDLDDGIDGVTLVGPLRAAGQEVAVCTGETEPARLGHALADGATALLRKGGPATALIDRVVRLLGDERPVPDEDRDELLAAYRGSCRADDERLRPFATLTRREQDVLVLLMDGVSPAAIAKSWGASIKTVRHHVENILVKLGARSQLQAVATARAAGWPTAG